MSINNPIIPPDSPLQRSQPAKNSKLVLAVSVILAIHVFLLAGLLIQGCKRQDANTAADQELGTNSQPSFGTTPSAPITEQHKSPPPLDTVTVPSVPANTPRPTPTTPPAPEPNSTVTDSPLASPSARTPAAPRPGLDSTNAGQESGATVYVTKSGDTLTKIAKNHGTTVKAIRALNNLKTDRILVGQKLKLPAAGTAPSGSPAPTPLDSTPH